MIFRSAIVGIIIAWYFELINVSQYRGIALDLASSAIFGKEKEVSKDHFYDLIDRDIDGKKEVSMSKFKGKVLLVVNVASKCGLTKRNYEQLNQLAEEYGKRGFLVLAFPCNQFLKQEPGTSKDILSFANDKCTANARNKYIFFEKADVNGVNTREVFGFLKSKISNADGSKDIRWNFSKFLIDHKGVPYERFSPKINPLDMRKSIEFLLDKKDGIKK